MFIPDYYRVLRQKFLNKNRLKPFLQENLEDKKN